ncbi:MAG: uracil-xanthine permease [Lachnospiraceae bacterium]|nr:uracil-xanthine permease [Lachnospiraceae bacterium]
MKLVYDVESKPSMGANLVLAFQQLMAITAATILVPAIVNGASETPLLNQGSALMGAGFGTLVYLFFTQRKSPVFLGSSFAFISPLIGAASFGSLGIILGAVFAGGVYVVIALIIKMVGTDWVNKLMPPVIIGPTVALIGLSLCGTAINDVNGGSSGGYNLVKILVGIITFFIIVYCSAKGNQTMQLYPFIFGMLGGYIIASIFTAIGNATGNDYLKIVDYSALVNNFSPFSFSSIIAVPPIVALNAASEGAAIDGTAIASLFVLFAPVAFVVFAEHIADHKNLSSVIGRDLIKEPGLTRTLLGDGVGSIVGSLFGGCPNTTYGESVGCVAITGCASTHTITTAGIMAIVLSLCAPFVAFINTLPGCVMGGACVALYGFIAVSGLKMLAKVDLGQNENLYVVSAILVTGVGGLVLTFGAVELSAIATALIVGIITRAIVGNAKDAPGGDG